MIGLVALRLLAQLAGDALLEYSEQLLPSRTPAAAAFRLELVSAVLAVTNDDQEERQLVKLARFESSFREDVGRCKRRGPQGEITAWQIIPRTATERALLCVSLEADARVALERVRESVAACAHLPPEERLSVYARGRCSSAEGRRLSRVRYAP